MLCGSRNPFLVSLIGASLADKNASQTCPDLVLLRGSCIKLAASGHSAIHVLDGIFCLVDRVESDLHFDGR